MGGNTSIGNVELLLQTPLDRGVKLTLDPDHRGSSQAGSAGPAMTAVDPGQIDGTAESLLDGKTGMHSGSRGNMGPIVIWYDFFPFVSSRSFPHRGMRWHRAVCGQ